MSKKLGDGSIVNSYFQTGQPVNGEDIYKQGMDFMIGQVKKIHFIDDASNVSKQFVEYDVETRDERGGQSTFRNVRFISGLGGTNDFDETILEANDFAFSGKLDSSNFFINKNGTIVLLAAIHGSKDKPFIAACIIHPKRKGAKRSDGIRKIGEFRGFNWEINNLGELTLTYLGNRNPDGKLVRPQTGPTQIKIDKDGVFTLTDNEGQLIRMDRVAKNIRIVTKENYEIVVGKDELITIGGDKTEAIQGKETTTTVKDYDHTAANMNFISAGDIKIGSKSASENLVLGIQFMNLYNSHQHIGNLGFPTSAPIQQMDSTQLSLRNFTEH